ncbi:MAG: GNAT family N-acetyltransferase, partial [Bryobacterales bacterium]|nr:GNAT family N-acetyltransferase [Bryobacterales bacterium]
MSARFRLEALSETHDRAHFSCGQEPLDRYIRTQATQDIRRRISSCFVAVEADTCDLAAYYTLAAASIPT